MSGAETLTRSGEAHWRDFGPRLSGLRSPLSPGPEAVDAFAAALAGHGGHVLLLGATAALFPLGERLTLIDRCADTVARLWPGDTGAHRAVVSDWREMASPAEPYSAVIGDGSFNALGDLADICVVKDRLSSVAPGALVAVRSFVRPEQGEVCDALAEAARKGEAGGFHAFKLRLLMAVAAERGSPQVPLASVGAAFDALFPDRAALSRQTGWALDTIAEIDAYLDSPATLLFPTRAELLAALGHPAGVRLEPSGSYECATLCPLVSWRLPA